MSKVRAGVLILAAFVPAVTACGWSDGSSGRPPTGMLIDEPRGAGVWRHSNSFELDEGNTASRRWLQGVNDFTETVTSSGSEKKAREHYRKNGPERVHSDIFADARVYDIGAKMSGADQTTYMCGEFQSQKCVTWWAWARYGKYTISLMYRHDPVDANALTDSELSKVVTNAGSDLAVKASVSK